MAGDWIKVESCTPDKPEVIKMSELLGVDQDSITGKLFRIWIWADQNSVDGNDMSVTEAFIDRLVFQIGFAKALRQVGWLEGKNGKLSLPKFGTHNGETAKKRAQTNRRVAKSRRSSTLLDKGKNHDCNKNVTQQELQKALPEKRREEIIDKSIIPPNPQGESVEKNIPELSEVIEVITPKLQSLNSEWTDGRATKAISLKYQTCIENKWRDGFNSPIKNWKLKFVNMLKNERHWQYSDDEAVQNQQFRSV